MRTDTRIAEDSTRPLNPGRPQAVPQPGRRRRSMTGPTASQEKAARRKRVLILVLVVLVVLAILAVAAYFLKELIESKYFFCSRSLKFIPLDNACDGTADCNGGEDESTCVTALTADNVFPVRLASSSKVLQVYQPESGWRTVCADDWSQQHTETACRQLGYTRDPRSSRVQVRVLPSEFRTLFSSVLPTLGAASAIEKVVFDSQSCSTDGVVSLSCSDCGEKPAQDRVVGGKDTVIEDWPWQVSLLLNGKHTCGGSLVSPQWIVTAAHCFSGSKKELSRWQVRTGQTYTGSTGGLSVDQVILHGDYDAIRNDYDIAMMRLSDPITVGDTRRPVCLPPFGLILKAQTSLVVTGWGYLEEKGKVSSVLQKAIVPLIDRATCSSRKIYGSNITPRMLCAGFLTGEVDACQGDSGGPLVYQATQWQLVGVVSWGIGCARQNKPGVYCNVDEVLNWIYTVMEKNS